MTVVSRLDRLIATLVRGRREIVGPCPEPEALVTWLAGERTLARRLELHLVACEECREDVIAASVAHNWTARVAAVSTRRMRLSSARLAARTSRRLRVASGDSHDARVEDVDSPRRKPPGGIGLVAGLTLLASLLWASSVVQAFQLEPNRSEAGVSMPGPESEPNALKRVAQVVGPTEDSDRR